MKRALLLPAVYLLDQFAGDPEWFPHPVRLMGLAAVLGEKNIRRPGQTPLFEVCAGAALTVAIVAVTYTTSDQLIRIARIRSPRLGSVVELLLGWTCLAAANLQQEAERVQEALEAHDLSHARCRLSRIVGRDTAALNVSEMSRALIETLAESASDGIIAPLFYLALGGVPLALAYKAVNTLDSMIGHADGRYLFFGKFAARLDDGANYIPARLTAAAIAITAGADAPCSVAIWLRDGGKHKSPNAGQPEAAMAGALQVCLGGENKYAGEPVVAEKLGSGFSPASPSDARRAARIVSRVTLLAILAGTASVLAAFSGKVTGRSGE